MRGKDEKEQSVRESERERERGTTETRVVFERDGEKEDEKSFPHHHFKNSNARRDDSLPQNQHIVITTNARCCEERERKNT